MENSGGECNGEQENQICTNSEDHWCPGEVCPGAGCPKLETIFECIGILRSRRENSIDDVMLKLTDMLAG